MDPDVILVGEIRDKETAEIAMEAALTGHLLVSTLHTTDAPSTIARFTAATTDETMLNCAEPRTMSARASPSASMSTPTNTIATSGLVE